MPRFRARHDLSSLRRFSSDRASAHTGLSRRLKPFLPLPPEDLVPSPPLARRSTARIGQRMSEAGPSPLPWYMVSTSTFHESQRATSFDTVDFPEPSEPRMATTSPPEGRLRFIGVGG